MGASGFRAVEAQATEVKVDRVTESFAVAVAVCASLEGLHFAVDAFRASVRCLQGYGIDDAKQVVPEYASGHGMPRLAR